MQTINSTDALTPADPNALALLINQLSLPSLPAAVIDFLALQCNFDTALVTIYKGGFKPILLYPTDPNEISSTLTGYLNTAYVLDPLYNAIESGCSPGVLRLEQIAPDSFHLSEYYLTCYKEFDLEDEINLLVALDTDTNCAITLGRRSSLGSITRAEMKRLNSLFPVIAALVSQFWSLHGANVLREGASDTRVKHALKSFGLGLLTRREQEISALILEGNSSKAIAEQLNISPGTVKVHRKNIHAKLNTSTQSEMFNLFLEHLSNFA